MRPEIVGYGAVALDTIIYVDRALAQGKGRIARTEKSYGGNIATALAAASRLGVSTAFVGWLPDPLEWPGVREDLADLGVDISCSRSRHGSPPIRSTILVDPQGERFIAYDDGGLHGAPPDIDIATIIGAKVLMIDSYAGTSSVDGIVAARAADVQVVADFETWDSSATPVLLNIVDHLVVSQRFAAQATGVDAPQAAVGKLWRKGYRAVVITDGDRGSWYLGGENGSPIHVPAFGVSVVDTTGCGDVFHGAYSAAVARGAELHECVVHASAAAALSATAAGGRGHLPTNTEVTSLRDGA